MSGTETSEANALGTTAAGCELLFCRSGRLAEVNRTESRILALPKDGDRDRFEAAGSGGGTAGGGCAGIGGTLAGSWAGSRPD